VVSENVKSQSGIKIRAIRGWAAINIEDTDILLDCGTLVMASMANAGRGCWLVGNMENR
jgi:hypothetical protein